MDIIIAEPITKYASKIYQGKNNWRYPSMTDVKWISESRIIAAHRYSGKIYIIDLCGNNYQIISTYTHMYNNDLYQTEAFEINREKQEIYLISYTEMLFILSILPSNKIVLRKSIQLNTLGIPYHGIRLHNNELYVTPSAMQVGNFPIKCVNVENYNIKDIPVSDKTIRIKHISFLPDNNILLLINYKTVTTLSMPNHYSSGCIQLYSSDFRTILDTYKLPSCHLDGMVMRDTIFYASCRDMTHGFIFCGQIVNNKIIEIKRIPCNDFPHGVDLLGSKIAYTSYTTSGIHFIDIT